MMQDNMETVLAIVGTFGTMALTVNAFFLRGIFQDLNALKVSFATITNDGKHFDKRLEDIEANQKEIFERLNIIEREVLK